MKRLFRKLQLVLFVSTSLFVFSACGSQMERDAKEMAKRAVEFEQTQKRFGDRSNLHGKPMSRRELEEYNRDYIEYANKMLEKYSESLEQRQEFSKMVNKKIKELKK